MLRNYKGSAKFKHYLTQGFATIEVIVDGFVFHSDGNICDSTSDCKNIDHEVNIHSVIDNYGNDWTDLLSYDEFECIKQEIVSSVLSRINDSSEKVA